MIVPSIDESVPEPQAGQSEIRVLVLGPEETVDHAARPDPDNRLEIRTATSERAALEQLEGVDCLVADAPFVDTDPIAFADRIRQRRQQLPIVFLAERRDTSLRDAVEPIEWTEPLVVEEPTELPGRLRRRIPKLVERKRLSALSQRSLAGIELAGDAIALVDPDDTIEFANRSFAMSIGYDRATLLGRSWKELFDEETVEHLESTAIPTATDGWRWTGTCTGRRRNGAAFTASIRIDGLEDGSMVFVMDMDGCHYS